MDSHQSEYKEDSRATDTTPPEDFELASVSESSETIRHGSEKRWSFRKKVLVAGSVSTLGAFAIVGLLFILHVSVQAGTGNGLLPLSGSDVKSRNYVPASERVDINMTAYLDVLDQLAFSDESSVYNETEVDTASFVVADINADNSLNVMFVEEPISTYRKELEDQIDLLSSPSNHESDVDLQNFWTDGINDPIRIRRTTSYPARVSGQFIAEGSHVCTGALIANRVVLTNGHCVFDINQRKWINAKFKFCPGRNGVGNDPYGCYHARFLVVSGNYYEGDWKDDWALMILRKPVNIGYLGFTTRFHSGQRGRLWHYSCEGPYVQQGDCGKMWFGHAPIRNLDGARAVYTMDTVGGSSGGSIVASDHRVIAVNAWSNRAGTGAGNRIRNYEYTTMLKYRQQYN